MHSPHLMAALGALLAGRLVQAQYYYPPPTSPTYKYKPFAVYDQSNFFDSFDFFTEPDPTQGFVEYVDGPTANNERLAGFVNGGVYLGVDSVTAMPAKGRKSVRMTSRQSFTHGLVVVDLAHMPSSTCGAWPAFWLLGANWPNQGEIDIIEGISLETRNQVTLHTAPSCSITNDGAAASTTLLGADCGVSGDNNAGCGQKAADASTYGSGFNAIGGGVYATEWTSNYIAVWFFPRGGIPADITAGSPSPSSWGQPLARFNGGQSCVLDQHFFNHNIVFDTTFCGTWAGAVWSVDPQCSALAPTCNDYVAANPTAFADAYWIINSLKVYQRQLNGTGTFARSFRG